MLVAWFVSALLPGLVLLKPDDAGAGFGGEVYWTLFDPVKIQRAGIYGSDVEDLVPAGLTGSKSLPARRWSVRHARYRAW